MSWPFRRTRLRQPPKANWLKGSSRPDLGFVHVREPIRLFGGWVPRLSPGSLHTVRVDREDAMSGPNTEYDPVAVTPLKTEEVEAARDAALAAIAAASDLEALKAARLEHAGDRSALALANREIGALPPQARKEAGQKIGQARGAVNQALAARQMVLEAEHEAQMLVIEAVDVTLPTDRVAYGARHPLTTGAELIADIFVAMGWEVAEGPLIEAEWLNFDALNLGPDHP